MRPTDRLNTAQRIVIVVALGIALTAIGLYLTRLGSPRFGWYAYPALTRAAWRPRLGLPGWLRLLIWLGLTSIWAVASVVVLRPPRGSAGSH